MDEFGVFFKVNSNLSIPDVELIRKMIEAEKLLNDHFEGKQKFEYLTFKRKPRKN